MCSMASNSKSSLKEIIAKIAAYSRKFFGIIRKSSAENWGFPFIVTFIVLLSSAAVLLASTNSSLANTIAVVAYVALVIGAILQIISYSKRRKYL